MDERRVCALFASTTLSRVRRICAMGHGATPEQQDEASRLTDLVHNVPEWLVGIGVPANGSLFDMLELFARSTGCEELVAAEFESVGDVERAARLRERPVAGA